MSSESISATLAAIVGPDYVLTDEASCILYAQDVFTRDKTAACVVQPETTEQLSRLVAAAVAAGFAVVPRGGGMSYTSGYVPEEDDSILVDTSRMDAVIAINQEDMYVTVQVGCSWKKLYEALKDTGLRTPFWGPLSGFHATVGGSISQSSVFFGAGLFGASADSVVSLDVVLADGSVLSTGSAAQKNGSPFFRHFGPDLTGLFTCDTGALGIKSTITLRLMPEFKSIRHVSYDFDNYESQIKALSEISRQHLAAQMFGTDPGLGQIRAQRDSLMNDVKALGGVLKAQDSLLGAVKQGAKIAMAGRRLVKNASYPVHANVEERCDAAADEVADQIAAICQQFGGKKIENSVPSIVRANPFNPLNNMVGPQGERWVPVHALLPHSKVIESVKVTEAIYEKYSDMIEKHHIVTGFLFTTVSTNCFFMEPLWFWPDELNELHRETVEGNVLAKQKGFGANLEARHAVESMRKELVAAFSEMGASHLQVGKEYIYRDGLKPEAFELIKAIKAVVDPTRRINPGCLGL
ncbi:FAD-binding oxidoreductase [Oceanicoccus sagamiensis]|uniref:FAD-binding protein n=1 Tax=Oceanicoccus sagamiensis TaxID=716816 RepID=A0A1X9N867_9GAMM|nr:FAD-binding oxidoreductase [Oceanicoccus sagamiensis]ARN73351.1 FAD-binding protein [Oceanicoccus sagamiensis]